MYCFSAFHVLLCMILYQQTPVVYLQSLVLTLETSPLKCREEVTLKCLYSGPTCCTDDARVWTRDGVQIMSNGATSDNQKYKEERNDASLHFDMKILNLEDTDFQRVFQCKYFFQTSNTLTLSKNDSYQCHPSDMGSCPFKVSRANDKMRIEGNLNISKVAPSPVLHAFYGEDNITSAFLTTELINYDTWYYFLTANIDNHVDCKGRRNDKLTVYVTIGSTKNEICQSDLCTCDLCGFYCWLISAIIPFIACFILFGIYYRMCCPEGETCKKKCEMYTLIWFGSTLLLNTVSVPIGIHHCPCQENWWFLFNFTWSFGTGLLIAFFICLARYDWSYLGERDTTFKIKMIALGSVTAGTYLLAAPAFEKKLLKGGEKKAAAV